MCKTFKKTPEDPWFEAMNPLLRLWMYESWYKDLEEKNDFARSYAILQGSFTNPDAAKKMIKSENPDFESSEEDFENISKKMIENNKQKQQKNRKHRRVMNG